MLGSNFVSIGTGSNINIYFLAGNDFILSGKTFFTAASYRTLVGSLIT
jgi:hypothetical protein